jgi:hypothetical protein
MIKEKQVTSSQMKYVYYNTETKEMVITFNNDKKYCYSEVPDEVYEALINAESIGSYFIKNVKTKYKYQLIG